MHETDKIAGLLAKFTNAETLSQDELHDLEEWIAKTQLNKEFFAEVTNDDLLLKDLALYMEQKQLYDLKAPKSLTKVIRAHFYRRRLVKFAAAAAAVLVLGTSSIFVYFNPNSRNGNQQVTGLPSTQILPANSKATLTLADNSTITLDSSLSGTVAAQGSTLVQAVDGQLIYSAKKSSAGPVTAEFYGFNTVTTPRGGFYRMTLPDGTGVWLNALSSLRFPTFFSDHERKVELTGEGYFEVAPDKSAPFKVSVNGTTVEVLGTHFNITAYQDEPNLKTTLLEGKVRVSNNKSMALLKPGQQALVAASDKINIIDKVNTEKAVAWKEGTFYFMNDDLQTVLRELSRWYNVEVEYRGPKPDRRFGGMISRNVNLSGVLDMLKNSQINISVKGGKIIVEQ